MRDPIRHKCGGGGGWPLLFASITRDALIRVPLSQTLLDELQRVFFAFGAVSVIRPVETLGTTFRMVATDGDAKNVQSLMQSADTFRRYLKTFLFNQAFLSRHC